MNTLTSHRITLAAAAALGLAGAPALHAAPPQPDLVIGIVVPEAAAVGADIGAQVRVLVKNIGRAPAPGTEAHRNGYMVDLTLGRDMLVPAGFARFAPRFAEDVLLKGGRISRTVDLPPGIAREYHAGAGIPNDTPPGLYFLCATVDPGGAVGEANEANNTRCGRIRIFGRRGVGPQEDLPNQFK